MSVQKDGGSNGGSYYACRHLGKLMDMFNCINVYRTKYCIIFHPILTYTHLETPHHLKELLLQINSSVLDRLLQRNEVDAQNLLRTLVGSLNTNLVVLSRLTLRDVLELRVLLAQDIGNLLVSEGTTSADEALTSSLLDLVGLDVSLGDVADIDVEGGVSGLINLDVRCVSGEVVENKSDGGVDRLRILDLVDVRPEDVDGVNDGQLELGLLSLNELPRGLLGLGLGGEVGVHGVVEVVNGVVVPVFLGELVSGIMGLHHGGEGGGDDDALDLVTVLVCSLEEGLGSLDSGVDEVLVGVLNVEVEGGSDVHDTIDASDGLVERTILDEILDLDDLELVTVLRPALLQEIGLLDGTGGTTDTVSLLQELLGSPGSDIASDSGNENEFARHVVMVVGIGILILDRGRVIDVAAKKVRPRMIDPRARLPMTTIFGFSTDQGLFGLDELGKVEEFGAGSGMVGVDVTEGPE
ncbi:hypothetical protein G7K_4421-t1 [Saitoella complicata NRRL Y-17804]|uniref:Uncharacterized protein n=1 Tax=Saitoella complicata (strain BCRC 22490 / CBS 7301 / JCM 7358 / NBRC 10748 / NRRL Y-17804) TaxID=698492 RepID=A0A0E9NKQ7_SAICN|nr:hypothetical protein G7K_4421-t1 [Saitoella complicata NRRL Y-17804]